MILDEIMGAVYELLSLNVDNKDIIIAFSPLTERMVILEMHKQYLGFSGVHGPFSELMGCQVYHDHPNNGEIVVYDKTDFRRERRKIIVVKQS